MDEGINIWFMASSNTFEKLVKQLMEKIGEFVTVKIGSPEKQEIEWGQLRGFLLKDGKLRIHLVDYQYPILINADEVAYVQIWNG
jgi:hypothetical protein